ncbi:hypothetical protein [Burkholderia mallei]|uniref:hypothetical protein n=1 Tax=Burkholderia mallei TaxID=13373 RepID=UPI0004ADC81B|nr:hypothetical protein [Burkholderia mallei]KOS89366.1 hypothetical protein DM53_3346 [Burkholderia mallei]KOS89976.1 hypothetical protein DM49_2505 [Burkholderia mallei]
MPGAPDERIRFEAFGPSGIRRPRIAVAIAVAIAIAVAVAVAVAPEKFPVSTSPKSRRQPKSLAARASAHLSFPRSIRPLAFAVRARYVLVR